MKKESFGKICIKMCINLIPLNIIFLVKYIYIYLHRNFQKYSTKLEMIIVLEGDWNKFEIGMGGW